MGRIICLDSGPLNLLTKPNGHLAGDRCRAWVRRLEAAGAVIALPEIIDYEVRRNLLGRGASASIVRLDRLAVFLQYDPITTPTMKLAAELWAFARRMGLPTAASAALDADVILAAQALKLAGPGDFVTVATPNVGHLGRFVDAEPWESIS